MSLRNNPGNTTWLMRITRRSTPRVKARVQAKDANLR